MGNITAFNAPATQVLHVWKRGHLPVAG